METMTPDWLQVILPLLGGMKDLTVTAALWLVLIGGAAGKWVFGHHHTVILKRLEKAEEQNQWLQERMMQAVEMADKVVSLAERRRR